MRATSSIINVCSAKAKLLFEKKVRFLSSAHLALQMDVSGSDEETSNTLNYKHSVDFSYRNCSRECFTYDMKGVGEFVDTKGILWHLGCKKDVEDDELRRVRLILECRNWDMVSCMIGYQRVELDQYNVIRILNVLWWDTKDAALALYFFRWCECRVGFNHSVRSVCTMINILISGNMNHRAVDLIRCLASKNDGEGWLRLISLVLHETHCNRKDLQTAFSMLVNCYLRDDKANAALKLISELSRFEFVPSMVVCCPLLKSLLQSGQMELAWDFLEEIMSHGLGCNISIISLFIHKLCMDGDLRSGWKLLTEIKKYGIDPDIVAYTEFLNALSKMGCLKVATVLLFKLASTGVVLDSVSASSVIDGYCKVGKIEKSLYLLKIFKLPLNIFVYNSYISKLCDDGEMLKASNIFNEMLEKGFYPDCFCYTTMIRGFCKIGDINEALNFLAGMLKRGIRLSPTTHEVLIDGYCKLGDINTAEELFLKMVTKGPKPGVVTYNTLINGYGRKGNLLKVFQLLHNMKSAGVFPDNVTYNILVHCLIEQGFAEEARELLDQLIQWGFSPDVITFTNLVSGFTRKGYFEEADRVWLLMGKHNINPDVVMCSALLSGYCRTRRMDEAKDLFFVMLGSGLVPDLILYNTLIYGFCSVGDVEFACYLIEMMVKQGIIPNEVTRRILALGYGKKWSQHQEKIVHFKLQEIMLKYGHI